jgi:hypothetical protein
MLIDKLPQAVLSAALKTLGQKEINALFAKGDIVEGRVVKNLGQNQAIVRFRGVDMMAVTQSRLAEGQEIMAKVESVTPQFTVSMVPGKTASQDKTTDLMRLLLPTKAPMGETLARALESVQTEPAGGGTPADVFTSLARDIQKLMSTNLQNITPQEVKGTLQNSGVYLESLLRKAVEGLVTGQELKDGLAVDLKANLSKALDIVEGKIATLAANLKSQPEIAATSIATKLLDKPAPNETTPGPAQTQTASKQSADVAQTIPAPKPAVSAHANVGDAALKELSQLHETAKSLRSALSNIELTQLLNSAVKKDDSAGAGVLMYQIPYMQNGSPETAKVYLKPEEDGEGNSGEGKKGGPRSLVFMLNMTKLGPVRVDVAVGAGHARGFIYVENEAVAAHVKASLAELTTALEPAGYRTDFVVKTADRRFLKEELETTASAVTPNGLVNIKA